MKIFSAMHCRAARGVLKWSQEQLAVRAQVSLSTVRDFEAERRTPIGANLRCIRQALEEAGVEFLNAEPGVRGPGVCLRWGVEMSADHR